MLRVDFAEKDVARLVRKLGAIKSATALTPAMERSVARLQRDLANYPAPKRKSQPAKSKKQRYFLRMLAERGGIPYKRTGNLGRSWTTEVDTGAGGVTGTVGNKTSYGPYVQGASTQSAYHAGTWGTDAAALETNRKAIIDDFADAIEDALKG